MILWRKLLLFSLIAFAQIVCAQAVNADKKTTAGKFTLVDGYLSMEYRYMEFKTEKGDTIYANEFDTCLTEKGYVQLWDTGGPPTRIIPAYLNKKYRVTYQMLAIPGPNSDDATVQGLSISKMELIK